jgi:hypothetical protein
LIHGGVHLRGGGFTLDDPSIEPEHDLSGMEVLLHANDHLDVIDVSGIALQALHTIFDMPPERHGDIHMSPRNDHSHRTGLLLKVAE